MEIAEKLKKVIPKPIRSLLRPVANLVYGKSSAEMSFWKGRHKIDQGVFENSQYERLMLAMAGEPDEKFLEGKIVADFGCGPRGSLVWAKSAFLRIGIDVLADRYADTFTGDIVSHGMIYLKSTEKVIPLPSDFVDVMFTLNAMDHVDSFAAMCREIIRVVKPGGDFIGSFNLGKPASPSEPQELNEQVIREKLLNYLEIQSYRITKRGLGEDLYAPFFEGELNYKPGEMGYLWVRAKKPVRHEAWPRRYP